MALSWPAWGTVREQRHEEAWSVNTIPRLDTLNPSNIPTLCPKF